MRYLIFALSFFLLSCSTIYVHNGADGKSYNQKKWHDKTKGYQIGVLEFAGLSDPMSPEKTAWHHIGVFGLVEFSEPVNPKQACRGGWKYVKTERNIFQGLIASVFGSLYSPMDVSVSCKK